MSRVSTIAPLVITLGIIVSSLGCSTRIEMPDERGLVAVTFAYGDLSYTSVGPVEPSSGCVDGCGCNGTGEERSGDGLAVVGCRCPETCECKAPSLLPLPEPQEPSVEPPLVPVAPETPWKATGPQKATEGLLLQSSPATCTDGSCGVPQTIIRPSPAVTRRRSFFRR